MTGRFPTRPPNAYAELHAGLPCRPHRGTPAAAPDGAAGGSEMQPA
jgi:hypothetical protein